MTEEKLIDKLREAFTHYLTWAKNSGKVDIKRNLLKSELAYQQIRQIIHEWFEESDE